MFGGAVDGRGGAARMSRRLGRDRRRRSLLQAALLLTGLFPVQVVKAEVADPFPVYATDACSLNAWLVPFNQSKAELSEFAWERLDAVAAAWHIAAGPVLLSGRVDGTEGDDPGLGQRRLDAVTTALVARGVPRDAVWARDDGGTRGFVENRAGISEPQNRIVLATLARGGDQCVRAMGKARADWLRRNCSVSTPKAGQTACDDALSQLY